MVIKQQQIKAIQLLIEKRHQAQFKPTITIIQNYGFKMLNRIY